MSGVGTRLRHWWQRNFGHVYLTETRYDGSGGRQCYRFKARFGRVNLCWWTGPFICRLAEDGKIVNSFGESMSGFGHPYPGWTWSYEPTTGDVKEGGAW